MKTNPTILIIQKIGNFVIIIWAFSKTNFFYSIVSFSDKLIRVEARKVKLDYAIDSYRMARLCGRNACFFFVSLASRNLIQEHHSQCKSFSSLTFICLFSKPKMCQQKPIILKREEKPKTSRELMSSRLKITFCIDYKLCQIHYEQQLSLEHHQALEEEAEFLFNITGFFVIIHLNHYQVKACV